MDIIGNDRSCLILSCNDFNSISWKWMILAIFSFFFPFSLAEKDIGKNSIEEIEKRKKFEISSEKYDMEGESVFEEYTWE